MNKYGKITSVELRTKEIGTKEGTTQARYGFANFETIQEANEAYNKLKTDPDMLKLINKSIFNSNEFVFFHTPKEIREKEMAMAQKRKQQQLSSIDTSSDLFKQFMEFMKNSQGGYQPG